MEANDPEEALAKKITQRGLKVARIMGDQMRSEVIARRLRIAQAHRAGKWCKEKL